MSLCRTLFCVYKCSLNSLCLQCMTFGMTYNIYCAKCMITGRVDLYDLVRCLDGGAQQADLKKRMRRVAKKDKVVDVPLSKHELEKVVHLSSPNLGLLHGSVSHDICKHFNSLIPVCAGKFPIT